MARPKKAGLEYYPQDTDIHADRKIRRLTNEFGAKGFMIYTYLLCLIYRDNGYWVAYDEALCFDISDYLKCGITEELTNEVINGCVRYGLFDNVLFDTSKILTSSGIQKRYLLAKRSGVIAVEMRVIAAETPVMDVKTPVIAAISTQSKVKESKVKIDDNDNSGADENSVDRSEYRGDYPSFAIHAKNAIADTVHFIPYACQQLTAYQITPEVIPKLLDEFNKHLKATDEKPKTSVDYRKHFINWVRRKKAGEIIEARTGKAPSTVFDRKF